MTLKPEDASIRLDELLTTKDDIYDTMIPKIMDQDMNGETNKDMNGETDKDGDEHAVSVSEHLWQDSGLQQWALDSDRSRTRLVGGGEMMWRIIRSPTSDIELLTKRQVASRELPDWVATEIANVSEYEKDVLWLFTLPTELRHPDAWPLNTLFFVLPFGLEKNKGLGNDNNNIHPVLSLFQFYKSQLSPWSNVAVPITTFVGPWMYVRRTLKVNLSFKTYCTMIYKALLIGLTPSPNMRTNAYTYGSMFIYIFFYIYGLVQSFETAAMMQRTLNILDTKLQRIRSFVATAQHIASRIPPECLSAFLSTGTSLSQDALSLTIPSGMSGIYNLMTDATARRKLKGLCNIMWSLDVCCAVNRLVVVSDDRYKDHSKDKKSCCFVRYVKTGHTRFWHMGHVCLSNHQVRNPAALDKSLIITGPNAAGKTTYVRSILTNIILSQSLGIACALVAHTAPVHALGSFIRISDQLGESSLFEAEVARCAELIALAEATSAAGKCATYFLDEPMHSTPPVEGSATSRAVLEYIGRLPGVRVLVTTHYHDVTAMDPAMFHNVSMDAVLHATKYVFPYKIQRGPSFKCIALELLEKNKLPTPIVQEAIRFKNESLRLQTESKYVPDM